MTFLEAGLLVGGGAVAGVVNTLAGGGSLLTVPLLTFAGLPADIANGTNRVGILIQNVVASWGFWREGVPGFAQAAPLVLPVVCGAVVGAYGVSQLDATTFQRTFDAVHHPPARPLCNRIRSMPPGVGLHRSESPHHEVFRASCG